MTQTGQANMGVGTQPLQIEVVRSASQWTAMRAEWDRLANTSSASTSLQYDWLRTWWEVYGGAYSDPEGGLRIVTCRREGRLVAALPLYDRRPARLYRGGRRLGFIGTGEREKEEVCSDYLDLLAAPDEADAAAAEIGEYLFGPMALEYDRLELCDAADTSPLVRWVRREGLQHDAEVLPRGVCPIADLAGGFEAYLGRLSSNTRQQCRRLMRQAERSQVSFEIATPSQREEFFAQLVELHQARWRAEGKPGCFAAARFAQFHRQLLGKWLPQGHAVLSRLMVGGRPVAVKYGFVFGDKFDFYQSGVLAEDAAELKSPGVVSFMYLMRELAGRGVRTFDFLRGSSSYKQRLATTAQPLVEVRLVRWTWRTHVGCLFTLGRRGGNQVRRFLNLGHGVQVPAATLQGG